MKKVFDFLKKNFVCAVATSSGDKPRSSIVDYYMVGDSVIIATSPDSIKANNLKKNNRISMSVHNDTPVFLTIDGKVAEATKTEVEEYNKLLFAKRPEFKMLMKDGVMPFVYYKVVIDTVYYNDYSKGMIATEIIKA